LPPPKWLVEGLFEQESLTMVVGPPGSFKSFLAIDWGLCAAVGLPWNRRAVEPSKVLYMLGEGKASMLKRIQAWVYEKHLDREQRARLNANFRVTFEVPQLAVPRSTAQLIDDLEREDYHPTLTIVDTLARSYVGKNENDAMDVGVWVDSADKLRQRGMAVVVLHHAKKNTEFGVQYRGNTAWQGAMDTSFILERNPEGYKGYAKLSCTKQKDHQEPEDVWLQHKHIRPRADVEGSIVLVETEGPSEAEQEEKEAKEAALNTMIQSLMENPDYPSDRARARELAKLASIPEASAQTKIHRARKIAPSKEEIGRELGIAE
jgi:RecA-family ATPase